MCEVLPVLFKTPAVHTLLRRVAACALGDVAAIRMVDQAYIASANCFEGYRQDLTHHFLSIITGNFGDCSTNTF